MNQRLGRLAACQKYLDCGGWCRRRIQNWCACICVCACAWVSSSWWFIAAHLFACPYVNYAKTYTRQRDPGLWSHCVTDVQLFPSRNFVVRHVWVTRACVFTTPTCPDEAALLPNDTDTKCGIGLYSGNIRLSVTFIKCVDRNSKHQHVCQPLVVVVVVVVEMNII